MVADASDIGRHRHRQQVRHWIAPQSFGDFKHQRGQHQTHGVVDEERREEPRHGHNCDQQRQRTMRVLHHPLRYQ